LCALSYSDPRSASTARSSALSASCFLLALTGGWIHQKPRKQSETPTLRRTRFEKTPGVRISGREVELALDKNAHRTTPSNGIGPATE
jgi:hypothetical protein